MPPRPASSNMRGCVKYARGGCFIAHIVARWPRGGRGALLARAAARGLENQRGNDAIELRRGRYRQRLRRRGRRMPPGAGWTQRCDSGARAALRARRVPARLERPHQRLAVGDRPGPVRRPALRRDDDRAGRRMGRRLAHLRQRSSARARRSLPERMAGRLQPRRARSVLRPRRLHARHRAHHGLQPSRRPAQGPVDEAGGRPPGARGRVLLPEYRGRFFRARRGASQQVRRRAERMHLLRRVRHRMQRDGQEHARFQLPRAGRASRRRRRTAQRGRADRARRRGL